jgi:hypothetical protein
LNQRVTGLLLTWHSVLEHQEKAPKHSTSANLALLPREIKAKQAAHHNNP